MAHLFAPGKLGDFRIATTGGRSMALNDFKGKPTLFFGWASWDPSRELLGEVEAFYRDHSKTLDVCSIAFDAEGPAHPMRYYTAAGCTHTPLIDATFLLRRAWGVQEVPFWVVMDEGGCIQASGSGFDRDRIDAALKKEPEHHKEAKKKPVHRFEKFEFLVQQVAIFLSRQRTEDALKALSDAAKLEPKNELVRVQHLAVGNPDRFYKGAIDKAWVKKQLATRKK